MQIIPVYKPKSVTSTEIVTYYQQKLNRQDVMHTGALDPMAEGLLLLAVGVAKVDDMDVFINAQKTYEFSGLWGIRTDSWDILGLVQTLARDISEHPDEQVLQDMIHDYQGQIKQQVPIFSNLRYRDKRFYQWAREGKAHLVPQKIRERQIENIALSGVSTLTVEQAYNYIVESIAPLVGDYRQQAVLANWKYVFEHLKKNRNLPQSFSLFHAKMTCEKGTYVRSLIHDLGERFGVGAVTWSIKRTAIGEYSVSDHGVDIFPQNNFG